ncbi:uncharacterized protein LOC119220279 [Pungitius pungitius]|uniref:uncharacterized protein LOC119220279 n=1 Tax=Pungitius pungitius TaxID=134920 RepID=UPI002E135D42
MSKAQMLRCLVKQRLTEAAEEIFGLFERTIAEYEEEASRLKEDNERLKKHLHAVFNPEVRIQRADLQQLFVLKEEQQKDPESPHIKEEQLQEPEEADIKVSLTPVKTEDDDVQSSQLNPRQTEQMETEVDGGDCGGPEPESKSGPSGPDTDEKTEDSSETERQKHHLVDMSDEEYIPDSETQDNDDDDDDYDPDATIPNTARRLKAGRIQVQAVLPDVGTSQGSNKSIPVVQSSSKGCPSLADHMVSDAAETLNSRKDSIKQKGEVELKPQVTHLTMTKKNYCYVCGKPQSKISRHLTTHRMDAEIVKAFSLPKHSKERKRLVEKMRNKGNLRHNTAVLQAGTGPLKVKRKPKGKALAGKFLDCMYCQGMYIHKELWRHARRCPFKPENTELNREPGRTTVPALAEA